MIVAFLLLAATSSGPTDESLYCHRVHARAWADAALLVFPDLVGEGFRIPNGALDPQLSGGEGTYQLRVGLAYSLSDLYRGVKTVSTASADCELEKSRVQLDEAIPNATDIGKLAALQKQLDYLNNQRPHWQAIAKVARDRLAAGGITYLDFGELHKRVTKLERKCAQVRGEFERIEAHAVPTLTVRLADVARAYAERSDTYEKRLDEARFAQAWQVRVSGGVVPLQLGASGTLVDNNRIDWYGLVELRIRLGAAAGDGGFLNARAAEVRSAQYEIPQKVAELHRELAAALRAAREELAIVERQVQSNDETITVLEHSNADRAGQAIAMLSLDSIDFRSDSVYLRALIEQLFSVIGDHT